MIKIDDYFLRCIIKKKESKLQERDIHQNQSHKDGEKWSVFQVK